MQLTRRHLPRLILPSIPLLLLPPKEAVADPAKTPPQFNEEALVAFHEKYNLFVRKLLACPPEAHWVEECKPAQGVLDNKLWEEVCEKAKKLFG